MAKRLKAFVRYDGSGRIVPSSVILAANKPKVGNWKEINAYECCNYAPPIGLPFDVTADWSLTTPSVVDEASFRTFLESGGDNDGHSNTQTGVVITDFLLEGNRLTCNVSSTGGNDSAFSGIDITDVTSFGNLQFSGVLNLSSNNISSIDNTSWPIGIDGIDMAGNSITSVNNVTWPSSLQYLHLGYNQIVTFNPSIALPNSLQYLHLSGNQIINFTPSLPLPSSLIVLALESNQIVNFDPLHDLPSGITQLDLNNNQIVNFTPSNSLGSGLEKINLYNNQIVNFDPSVALPSSLQRIILDNNQIVTFDPSVALPVVSVPSFEIYLINNQIVTFNPSIALPSGLTGLYLGSNQIVSFNPTIALPNSLQNVDLNTNQMTTAGYTASEPWANAMSVIPGRGNVFIGGNVDSVSGTNLQTILIAKGWNLYV